MPTAPRSGPPVAVIVVLFNSAEDLPGLIDSLPAGLAGTSWQLIAVDNASSDRSVETVKALHPDAIVVETGRNGGYAAGINAGAVHAPDDAAILILNPDVRLHEDSIAHLLAALAQPGTGIAVPKLIDGHGRLIESQRRDPTVVRALADAILGARRAGRMATVGEVVTDPRRYERTTELDWAEGSTILVSSACARACGPWDESFFLYSEETEFMLRARDRGFSVRYEPAAGATHLEGGSSTTPALWALLAQNRVRLFRQRHGRIHAAAFWFAVVLREATRAVAGQRTARAALRALLSPTRMREKAGPDSIRSASTADRPTSPPIDQSYR